MGPQPRVKSPGNDTIAAVATGAGGGIGIVRISGPDALRVAALIFRGRAGRPLEACAPFLLVLGTASDPDSSEPIDEVLAVRMPEGRSYTGESTVEIQGHGGRVVLEAVLQATLRAGARHAGPGEFTKRAFLSGRLDLTQAEAVAELISAEDDVAARRLEAAPRRGGRRDQPPARAAPRSRRSRGGRARFRGGRNPRRSPLAVADCTRWPEISGNWRRKPAGTRARRGISVAFAGRPTLESQVYSTTY